MSFQSDSESILNLLYQAPGDRAGWQCFLDSFSKLIDATVVTYATFDAANSAYSVNCMSKIDPEFPELYQEHFAAIDEWYLAAKGVITSEYIDDGRALVSNEDLIKTRFYNEFLRPFGLLHESAAVLEMSETSVHALTLLRHREKKEFSQRDLALLRAFVPHIKRAAKLHRRFVDLGTLSNAQTWLLDQVSFGVVILNADSTILLANKRARELCRGDRISLSGNRLRVSGVQSAAVDAMIRNLNRPELHTATPMQVILRRERSSPLVVSVGRVPTGVLSQTKTLSAVFIQEAIQRPQNISDAFGRLFSLTPAEARVAGLLAQGLSMDEIGETLSVSRNTIKTQAKAIYSKASVRSQKELISLGQSLLLR